MHWKWPPREQRANWTIITARKAEGAGSGQRGKPQQENSCLQGDPWHCYFIWWLGVNKHQVLRRKRRVQGDSELICETADLNSKAKRKRGWACSGLNRKYPPPRICVCELGSN